MNPRKKQTLLAIILIVIFLFVLILAFFLDSKQSFNSKLIFIWGIPLIVVIIGIIIFYNTRGKQDEIKIIKEGIYLGQRYLGPNTISELRNMNKLSFQKREKRLIEWNEIIAISIDTFRRRKGLKKEMSEFIESGFTWGVAGASNQNWLFIETKKGVYIAFIGNFFLKDYIEKIKEFGYKDKIVRMPFRMRL